MKTERSCDLISWRGTRLRRYGTSELEEKRELNRGSSLLVLLPAESVAELGNTFVLPSRVSMGCRSDADLPTHAGDFGGDVPAALDHFEILSDGDVNGAQDLLALDDGPWKAALRPEVCRRASGGQDVCLLSGESRRT